MKLKFYKNFPQPESGPRESGDPQPDQGQSDQPLGHPGEMFLHQVHQLVLEIVSHVHVTRVHGQQ